MKLEHLNTPVDFDEYPMTEMVAKKICSSCGKSMSGNHYWYKGGWKCKGVSDRAKQRAEKRAASPKQEITGDKLATHTGKYHVSDEGSKRGIEHLFK